MRYLFRVQITIPAKKGMPAFSFIGGIRALGPSEALAIAIWNWDNAHRIMVQETVPSDRYLTFCPDYSYD